MTSQMHTSGESTSTAIWCASMNRFLGSAIGFSPQRSNWLRESFCLLCHGYLVLFPSVTRRPLRSPTHSRLVSKLRMHGTKSPLTRYGVLPKWKRQQLYLYLWCPNSVTTYSENGLNWDNFKKQGTCNFQLRHPRCVEYKRKCNIKYI
jgi:hypothetical protein